MKVHFMVDGVPVPQGSKTLVGVKTGNPRLINANDPVLRPWRKAVREAAEEWVANNPGFEPLDEPCTVVLKFVFPRVGDALRTRHCVKPDGDKVERAVRDSLQDGGIVKDDSRFWRSFVTKVYGDRPGVTIEVFPEGDEESEDRMLLRNKRKTSRVEAST